MNLDYTGDHMPNTNTHQQSKALLHTIESELQLLRHWILNTCKNYRHWRHAIPGDANFSVNSTLDMQRHVRNLISRSLRVYRHKQKLYANLCLEFPYLNAEEITYYQYLNHYGETAAKVLSGMIEYIPSDNAANTNHNF